MISDWSAVYTHGTKQLTDGAGGHGSEEVPKGNTYFWTESKAQTTKQIEDTVIIQKVQLQRKTLAYVHKVS